MYKGLAASVLSLSMIALQNAPVAAEGTNAGRITGYCSVSVLRGIETSCEPEVPFTFSADGSVHRYVMTITAPATHCSKVSYRLRFDGQVQAGVGTERLSPGESSRMYAGNDWPEGPVTVWISARGYVGGCNTGRLESWAADISVR